MRKTKGLVQRLISVLFSVASAGVFVLFLTSCAAPHVVADNDGIIVVKGPRKAFGPGHEAYTREAQEIADRKCAQLGRDRAAYLGSDVRLFDGDYTRFSCMVSTDRVLRIPEVANSLGAIGHCVRSKLIELDDLSSDAATVSSGIAIACTPTIDAFLTVFLEKKQATRGFATEFRKSFKLEQHQKILPFVLKWRNLIRTGRDKSQRPSEAELPNSLIQI